MVWGPQSQALRALLRLVTQSLEQCSTAAEATIVLQVLYAVLPSHGEAGGQNQRRGADLARDDAAAHKPHVRQLLLQYRELNTAVGHSAGPTRAAALWEGFDQLLGIVVTAESTAWWPFMPSQERAALLAYLETAPAPLALSGLSEFLGSLVLSPTDSGYHSASRTEVSLAGSHTIGQALQDRFHAAPSQGRALSGVQELVLGIAAAAEGTSTTSNAAHASQGLVDGMPNAYHHLVSPTHVAGLLVALPDRLAPLRLRGTPPRDGWYASVLSQLLAAAAWPCALLAASGTQQRHDTPSGALDAACEGVGTAAGQLAAALMARLVARGSTHVVAQALLQPLHDPTTFHTHQPWDAHHDSSAPPTTHVVDVSAVQSSNSSSCSAGHQAPASPCWCTAQGDGSGGWAWPADAVAMLQRAVTPALTAGLLDTLPSHTPRLVAALLHCAAQPVLPALLPPPWQAPPGAAGGLGLAASAPGHDPAVGAARHLLGLLGGAHALAARPELRWTVAEQLLAATPLPAASLGLLLRLLEAAGQPTQCCETVTATPMAYEWWAQRLGVARAATGDGSSAAPWGVDLPDVAAGLAALWADASAPGRTGAGPPPRRVTEASRDEQHAAVARAGAGLPVQGYQSCVLVALLSRLSKAQLEGTPGLLAGLLQGVSLRLGSPQPVVRIQGMRVGRALSLVLDPTAPPLFGDQGDLGLAPPEMWPGALLPSGAPPQGGVSPGDAHPLTPPDSDDEEEGGEDAGDNEEQGSSTAADSDDETDSLEAFGLEEDAAADAWARIDPQALQLRAVAAALRKSDDVSGVLAALPRVELLVRAAPDELDVVAGELTRALLHCRVPEWAEPDPGTGVDQLPEAQRSLALAAVVACSPLPAGDSLLLEVLSPHLDTYQRLLVLQSLAAAAQELSNPGAAPTLQYAPGQPPRLTYPTKPHGAPPQPAEQARLPGQQVPGTVGGAPGTVEGVSGKTRVWGHVARRRREQPLEATHRNSFADVALRWTQGLLREVDVVKHGVDLLGRDTLLLSALLHTLGVFAECATSTPVAAPVAAAVLELLSASQVHGHAEAAVRRAALLASGQVLAALPAPFVAGLLQGEQPGGGDTMLGRRIRWVQGWLEGVRSEDGDETCRRMAGACLDLHTALAAETAMHVLSLGAGAWPEQLGGVHGAAGGLGGAGSVSVGPMGMVRQAAVLLPHQMQ